MMHIAFRTDATTQIGTGHFMRCLTLADALKKQGALIRFISRALPAHLSDMLAAKGMEFTVFKNGVAATQTGDLAHAHWLETSQAQDAQETAQALADRTWDWLVVDHYALDARWESAMRETARQIMVIDDIADRQHDCDVLLDQNYYQDMKTRYTGKVPARCQLLLGPRYALLREEFLGLRENVKPRKGEVKRILVFFGGVDADNYTGATLQALSGLNCKDIGVDIIIGAQHPHREEIEKACAAQGYVCHVQTTRMAELMAAADFAIGAGGTATWERCCLGLPTLCICGADNQRNQIADAADAGLLYAPSGADDLVRLIRCHTQALFENPHLRNLISSTAMNEVDGKGIHRIASIFAIDVIKIRPANESDSQNLFDWRNHLSIRSVSRNSEAISWDAHRAWLSAFLAKKENSLLIGFMGSEPVGVIRFDKEDDIAEVSIYLVPDGKFMGQGRNLLFSAERWLKVHRPDIKSIRAVVLGKNIASQKLFIGAHYHFETISYLKEV